MPGDISRTNINIEDVQKKSLILEKEVESLRNTVSARDAYIKGLADEKIALNNQVIALNAEVTKRDEIIKKSEADKQALIASYEVKVKQSAEVIAQKENEVKTLQDKINAIAAGAKVDKTLLSDLESLKVKYESVQKDFTSTAHELSQKRVELEALKSNCENLIKGKDGVQKLYLAEQQKVFSLQQQLDLLNQRLQVSLTAPQMADYFTKAIDAFNSQTNISDPSVNYIIGEMNVDLKASVGKNDKNEMILAAPHLGAPAESSMSSIKFTIRAVPKKTE